MERVGDFMLLEEMEADEVGPLNEKDDFIVDVTGMLGMLCEAVMLSFPCPRCL